MSKFNLKGIVLSSVAILALLANSSNPPNGNTGAPGEGTCASCHNPLSTSIAGVLDISGVPSTIDPSTTYSLVVTSELTGGSATRAGFQMVAFDESNNNTGTFSNAGPSSNISGGYFEHSPALNFSGGSSVSWSVDWTSPAGPDNEDISFYAASILANGNGNNGGDQLILTDITGTLDVGVVPLSLTIVFINEVSCPGEIDGSAEIMINGGVAPFTVNWDNGETGVTATMLPAGWVEVFVEDAVGAMTASSIFIGEPDAIAIDNAILTDASCGNPGSIELELSGGTSPYNFSWSDGSNSNPISGINAGDYDVTITDSNGCELFGSYTLNASGGDISTEPEVSDVNCFGGSNGIIALNIDAANGVGSISWSTGQTTETITDLTAGTYSVTVTDNSGCQYSETIMVGQADPITLSFDASNEILCFGQTVDTLILNPSGGNGNYTIFINNQMITDTLFNWAGGIDTFTVVDQFMCTDTAIINIPVPTSLSLSTTVQGASSPGSADGCISVQITGGTPPYFYNGMVVSNPFNLNNLSEGVYTLVFTDSNGCSVSVTETVSSTPCMDDVIATIFDANCFGESSGSISLNVSTGYTMIWSTGQTGPTISGLTAGTYSVTVVETATNCSQMINNLQVSSPAPLEFSVIDITQPQCISGFAILNSVIAIGGTGPYTYELPTQTLSIGTYSVSVIDANGCRTDTTIEIVTQDVTPPTPVLNDITVYVDADGSIGMLDFDGGSTDNCNEGVFTEIVSVIPNCTDGFEPTMLDIIVSDQSSNTATGTTFLTILDSIAPDLSCPADMTISDCTSFILPVAFAEDNCGVMDFSQTSGPTSSDQLTLGLNELQYRAIDFHGNVSVCSYFIDYQIDLSFDIEINQPTCAGIEDGSYFISAPDTPTSVINYQGENENLGAGVYYFEVTDTLSNCSITDSIIMMSAPMIVVDSFNIETPTTTSGSDGNIEVFFTGGNAPFTFKWLDSDGNLISTEQNVEGVPSGVYTLIISDANGCEEMILIEIPMSTSIDHALDYSVKVYPNPVSNTLFIETDQVIQRLLIYDAQGKLIHTFNNNELAVDMSYLSSGLIILGIQIENKIYYHKIFKN